jgi:cell division protein FtsL
MSAVAGRARPRAAASSARSSLRHRAAPRRKVARGAVWIGVVACLLAGVVALNVAVLRLNLRMDDLSSQRAKLQTENAALSSQVSSAAAVGQIEALARRKLGLVPADPNQTTFVHLGR